MYEENIFVQEYQTGLFPIFFRLIYRLNLKNKNINKKIGHLKY